MEQTAAVLLSAAAEKYARIDRLFEVSNHFEARDARTLIEVFYRARTSVIDPSVATTYGRPAIHHGFPSGVISDCCFRSDARETVFSVAVHNNASDTRNVRARALTNKTLPGFNNAFGVPQVHFASEILMWRIAAEIDLDPLQVSRRNLVLSGSRKGP